MDDTTLLRFISDRLEDLCSKIATVRPEMKSCYGYDPAHISSRGKIMMCTDYINEVVDSINADHDKLKETTYEKA